ncbi:hypothetical protein HYR99_40505 [Candidatus Poribacteria bacterium]|nr:hypothetical protein [Candidatus Poribacteria bacterium]
MLANGVCSKTNGSSYIEVNQYGIAYYRESLHCEDSQSFAEGPKQFLQFPEFVYRTGALLKIAGGLYAHAMYFGNIHVSTRIDGVFEKCLRDHSSFNPFGRYQICFDDTIFSETIISGNLSESQQRQDCIIGLMGDILWAFNMQPDLENMRERIQEILVANHLC